MYLEVVRFYAANSKIKISRHLRQRSIILKDCGKPLFKMTDSNLKAYLTRIAKTGISSGLHLYIHHIHVERILHIIVSLAYRWQL